MEHYIRTRSIFQMANMDDIQMLTQNNSWQSYLLFYGWQNYWVFFLKSHEKIELPIFSHKVG